MYWKKNIDSMIAAIAAFVLVQLFTQYGGVGISPDSIAYMSVARNVIGGEGFVDFNHLPLVSFPLFYPLYWAVWMGITGKDIVQLAPVVNGLMYAAVVGLSGVVMEQFKYRTVLYKRIMLAILLFSPALLEIYTMLWSETLFILLSLVFVLMWRRYFETHRMTRLIVAALVAALAFDTRFAGITFVGTGCLLILFDKQLSMKLKWQHSLVFGGISVSLVALNLIRNYWLQGLATGMRQKGVTPLYKNVEYSGAVFRDWFNIPWGEQLFLIVFALALFGLFAVFFVRNVRHWKAYYSFENISVAFFLVYVLFIVGSSTLSRYETINNRLLGPIFIPLLWTSTCQLPKWRKQLSHRWMNRIFLAFTVGIGVVLLSSYYLINRENMEYMNESGIPGYAEDDWRKSELIHYLQHDEALFNPDSLIYSNHSQAVYFLTGHAVSALPERVYTQDVDEFKAESPSVLVWFDMEPNAELLTLKEISGMKKMYKVKTFPDGAIYVLKN